MNSLRAKFPQRRVKFKVGGLVRITKEKVKFAKGYVQTFSTEIFRVVKVIKWRGYDKTFNSWVNASDIKTI
jgi:hypothetical protein